MNPELFAIILALIGGGGVTALGQYLIARQKAPVDAMVAGNEALRETVETLRTQIAQQTSDNSEVRSRVDQLESTVTQLLAELHEGRRWIRIAEPLLVRYVPEAERPDPPDWLYPKGRK